MQAAKAERDGTRMVSGSKGNGVLAVDGAERQLECRRDDQHACGAHHLGDKALDDTVRQVLDDLIANHEVKSYRKVEHEEVAAHKADAARLLPDPSLRS